MKKTFLLVIFLSLCLFSIASEHLCYLVILGKDSTRFAYSLSDQPRFNFTDSDLVIVSNKDEKKFALENIIGLTYQYSSLTEETATICFGESYTWQGQAYAESGDYSITLQDVNGCDSVVTLHLTVLPEVPVTEETATICLGELYTWQGQAYAESGDYSVTLQDVNGCDSVITLHLTILPETPTGYNELIHHNIPFEYAAGVLHFHSLQPYDVITIYSVSGIFVFNHEISQEVEYSFNISDFELGVYILKINERTYKIIVK